MTKTPHTTIRLPEYLKKAIRERTTNLTGWIIQAVQEKLKRDKHFDKPVANE